MRRWWRRLKVPPTLHGCAANRWTEADAQLLLARWKDYCGTTTTTQNHDHPTSPRKTART
jgi:hypothetical protein